MKENYDKCLQIVLKHEGGFVNHPLDPGGVTNLGITKRTYERYLGREVTIQEMRDLTPEKAGPIYKTEYWNKVKGDSLPKGVDLIVFDFAVNAGPSRATKTLQRLLAVNPDGAIGPKTIQALKEQHNIVFLILAYKNERLNFYKALSTFETFGKGWTRRVQEVTDEALTLVKNPS